MTSLFDQNIPPFTISPEALEEIRKTIEGKNIPQDYGLRVGIKGGAGCGGATFIIGFDKKKDEDDVFLMDEISIYMEKKHAMFLAGKKIDFEDGATARGFTFSEI
jgi:iron-sulfur cluster assembly protein